MNIYSVYCDLRSSSFNKELFLKAFAHLDANGKILDFEDVDPYSFSPVSKMRFFLNYSLTDIDDFKNFTLQQVRFDTKCNSVYSDFFKSYLSKGDYVYFWVVGDDTEFRKDMENFVKTKISSNSNKEILYLVQGYVTENLTKKYIPLEKYNAAGNLVIINK